MFIIKFRKYFYAFSLLLVGLSLFAIFYKGLPLGIQFTGGSLLEVVYPKTQTLEGERVSAEHPTLSRVKAQVVSALDDVTVVPTGERGFIIRTGKLDETGHKKLLEVLSFEGEYSVREKQFSFIGPTIGQELRTKAWYAIVAVVIATILYVAYAFRSVSKPVSSWKYSFVAILTLIHDCLIPTGLFAFLGLVLGYEINVLFVIAILTIFGYSINDTIVVFDRIRENLRLDQEKKKKNPKKYQARPFAEVCGKSLEQTFTRSLNTSVTVLIVVMVLYFLGSPSTQNFALVLTVGTIAGSYSSLFIATPLLVTIEQWQEKRKKTVSENSDK